MESLRASDTKAEQAVACFLDKYLYARKEITGFIRFHSKEDQLIGKDVKFTWNGIKDIIVDEKAQAHYVNKPLPTFILEVDFVRRDGTLTEGWLFDSKKATQYYLFIWITADKPRDFKAEDITNLECLLVNREDVILFLYRQGITKERCEEISREIRKSGVEGKHHEGEYDNFYFYFSAHLAEAPINIVIRKDKLKELATETFDVNRSG